MGQLRVNVLEVNIGGKVVGYVKRVRGRWLAIKQPTQESLVNAESYPDCEAAMMALAIAAGLYPA
jgi:hypothetical protein